MCSYITEKVALFGSAKGGGEWRRIDAAQVYFDHPFDAPLDHALGVDLINEADGGRERIAIELSAETARALAHAILAALDRGDREHGTAPEGMMDY
ncbi:MAG: hypothetical protein JWN93_2955 [Hyphomicrobiales bacterium]|nr:hypothetical protein [Hyphomicrobiales bacterium]